MVHPSVKILAEGGPIIIGENNLIQEKAIILNRYSAGVVRMEGPVDALLL